MTYKPSWDSGGGGGGSAVFGTVTLDFGAFPGSNETSGVFADVAVTGTSKTEAFIAGNATTQDHTANDHRYASGFIALSAAPSAGVGVTVYATSHQKMQGTFLVRCKWEA